MEYDYAELERKKKLREQQWWKTVLAYYMMEGYRKELEQAYAQMSPLAAFESMSQMMLKNGAVDKLFEKKEGMLSPLEMLERMNPEEGSAFHELLTEMKRKPPLRRNLARATARVVVEEPPRVLERAAKERERTEEWKRAHPQKEYDPKLDEKHQQYEDRLQCEMSLLRMVMPPKLFKDLCSELERQGRKVDLERDFMGVKDPKAKKEKEQEQATYKRYVEKNRVDPKEKAGKLANSDDVFTAAAYMLAAYEQKDNPEFDERKADARAMELSGSRAFRVYMKGHPGSMLAAARNTGLEATHDSITALDGELKHRDAVLCDARDSLKSIATGKTARFHKMLNTLDRFTNMDVEPSKEEKRDLTLALADYAVNDCAPTSREGDKLSFQQSMRAIKALVPEKDFDALIDRVNIGRDPKVKAADFDLPVAGKQAPEREAPEAALGEAQRVLTLEKPD